MGVQISYMGTKHRLSSTVNDLLQRLPDGSLLDAFSGMCSVGAAVAPNRPVWTNDVQPFPALVGKRLVSSRSGPLKPDEAWSILEAPFKRNLRALQRRFRSYLDAEEQYLTTRNIADVIAGNNMLPYVGNNVHMDCERRRLEKSPNTFPYRLATITYVGSYFGASQCMEVDSIRCAIDTATSVQKISLEQRDWLIIAVGQALTRVNNSTGQFAQYLKPHSRNLHRFSGQRSKSVLAEFLRALETICPLGTANWRSENYAFQEDALLLLRDMQLRRSKPSIVFADPPYSKAQYSRYYHVLDVFVDYRYPAISSVGRYPTNRFQTTFANASSVESSMTALIRLVSELKASLILSYPENGLFNKRGGRILKLLREYFSHVEVVSSEVQQHSTFGGRAALPKLPVLEHVYLAR